MKAELSFIVFPLCDLLNMNIIQLQKEKFFNCTIFICFHICNSSKAFLSLLWRTLIHMPNRTNILMVNRSQFITFGQERLNLMLLPLYKRRKAVTCSQNGEVFCRKKLTELNDSFP